MSGQSLGFESCAFAFLTLAIGLAGSCVMFLCESLARFLYPDLAKKSFLQYEDNVEEESDASHAADQFKIKELQRELAWLRKKSCPNCMFYNVNIKYPSRNKQMYR